MATNYNRQLRVNAAAKLHRAQNSTTDPVDVAAVVKALSEESKMGRLKWLTPHPKLVNDIVPPAPAPKARKGFLRALLHRFI